MDVFDWCPTKSALKRAIKKGLISVNGEIAQTGTYINTEDTIELTLPKIESTNQHLNLPLTVLYEDDYLAVIDKPGGILVSGNKFVTVANGLSQNLKKSTLEDATTPTPVHRLDYGTTGALLVGKTGESIRKLNELFSNKEITKTYFAVTIGQMNPTGRIVNEIEGKPSISNYKVIDSAESPRFSYLNLVELRPETGRRHQLRIHLASIGNPILGDRDYTPKELLLIGKGIYLHAYSLEFKHPFTHKVLKVNSPLPKKFQKLFARLSILNS